MNHSFCHTLYPSIIRLPFNPNDIILTDSLSWSSSSARLDIGSLSIFSSLYLSIYIYFFYLSTYLSFHPFIYVYLSIHISTYYLLDIYIHLLSIYLSIYVSTYISLTSVQSRQRILGHQICKNDNNMTHINYDERGIETGRNIHTLHPF